MQHSDQNSLVIIKNPCPPLCAYILALHCDNCMLHMYMQMSLLQKYAQKNATSRDVTMKVKVLTKVDVHSLFEISYFTFIHHLCLFCTVHTQSQ